jgi:hypothetical protein
MLPGVGRKEGRERANSRHGSHVNQPMGASASRKPAGVCFSDSAAWEGGTQPSRIGRVQISR